MKLQEGQEDYLKAIYIISKTNKGGWVSNSEIADFLKVTPSSVTGMLHKLEKKGFIRWKPRSSLHLTNRGKKIAEQMESNFKRLKEFFTHVLKLDNKELINKLSCGIEHHLTPEVSCALKELIP